MTDRSRRGDNPKQSLGFLTVVECPRDGLFGGYLVLNFMGRPLEFHCTAPIKPNRAQQILYGPTLDSYLYGEQIAGALIKGAKCTPQVVFTNRLAVLQVRDLIEIPIALVEESVQDKGEETAALLGGAGGVRDEGSKAWRVHSAHADETNLKRFHWGRNRLATHVGADSDSGGILDQLKSLQESFDLSEPFARICEAIEEARGVGSGC